MTTQYAHRGRMAVGVLAASGLALGLGVQPAAADEIGFGLDWLRTPSADRIELQGSEALVTFTDHAETDTDYFIGVFAQGDSGNSSLVGDPNVGVSVQGVPGAGRSATRTVGPVPTDQALCARVQAVEIRVDGPAALTNRSSAWSNEVCADPAVPASDVALENIRGNANPQAGASPAYLVALRNPGGTASGVNVDVSTSGVATLGDQAGVAGGWSANGFSCSSVPPSGGQTSALRCTGGRLAAGENFAPAVIVKFTGPGMGTVHAQVSGGGDTNPGNNGTALNVTVG